MDGCTLNDFLDAVLNIELARPLQDICSNRFFHGKLNRQTTETLLNQDGHFLVRESSTQTGEYVLSCRFKGTPMHFIIHEYPLSVEENGQRQYAFDGPKFSSVAQLIAFYVDNQQPITQVSNALICEPVQRNLPLNAKALKKYYWSMPNASLEVLLQVDLETLSSKFEVPDRTEENSLPDCTPFSSEYLKQLQTGASAITLEGKCEKLLSGANLSEQVCDTIAHTGPGILASHLFKRNLLFFGLDFEGDNWQSEECILQSGIELMCLPTGRQLRRDIIIRNECLKYMVIHSVLNKGTDTDSQCDILSKWIQVASKLLSMLGDHFGFGALMAGLCHPAIGRLSPVWQLMRSRRCKELTLFETVLRTKFYDFLKAREPLAANTSIPFVIQLCHLIECSSIVNTKVQPAFGRSISEIIAAEAENHTKVGLADFSLDNLTCQIEQSASILEHLSVFERNALTVFNGFFFKEPLLDELFKTSFQLRFLFHCDIDPIQLNHQIFLTLEDQLTRTQLPV